MMIYNKGGAWWEEEKNEETLDDVVKNGVGGDGRQKDSTMKQYHPMCIYDYMNGVNLCCVQP